MPINKKYLLIFIIVLLVGGFLRFSNLEHTPFQSHVVADLEISKDIAEGNEFRLAGVTSGRDVNGEQQNFGPISYYIFALPLIFTKSPLAVVGLISLFSIFSAILCYKFGKEFFNERIALIAASLYAVSPWAIFFSNVITCTFLMPFFVMLFIYSMFKLIIKNKDRYFILCLVSLAILLQLHLSALLLIPVLLLSLLFFKRKINLKHIALGLFSSFLFFMPFIYHNLSNLNGGSIFSHMINRPASSLILNAVEALGTPFMLAGTYFGKYFFGQDYIFNNSFASTIFLAITAIIVVCLLLGTLFILYNGARKLKKEYILLLIWLIVPILSYLFLFRKNISPHFYIILLPVQFLILGILFNHTYSKRKLLTILAVFMIIIASISYSVGFFNYLDEKGGSIAIYKLTYETKTEIVDYILEDSNKLDPSIYYIGEDLEGGYRYIFEQRGAYPKYIQLSDYNDLHNVDGYFISERYWRQYWFNENPENKILSNLDKETIHNIEVFKLFSKE